MVGRTQREIREPDVQGLKYLRKLRPLLSRLRKVGTERITAVDGTVIATVRRIAELAWAPMAGGKRLSACRPNESPRCSPALGHRDVLPHVQAASRLPSQGCPPTPDAEQPAGARAAAGESCAPESHPSRTGGNSHDPPVASMSPPANQCGATHEAMQQACRTGLPSRPPLTRGKPCSAFVAALGFPTPLDRHGHPRAPRLVRKPAPARLQAEPSEPRHTRGWSGSGWSAKKVSCTASLASLSRAWKSSRKPCRPRPSARISSIAP